MYDVSPTIGVPYDASVPKLDLIARAEAACNAAMLLNEYGLELEVGTAEKDEAAALAIEYAEDPESLTKHVGNTRLTSLRPASLLLVDQILNEFGHSVAENAATIRNLVTNKLLIESENADPRIRLRAIELLGKVSDVGLFTEKSEVTVRNKSSGDIRDRLRKKLSRLADGDELVEDAVLIESVDIDEAFGLVSS